jgi:hypothetical protein
MSESRAALFAQKEGLRAERGVAQREGKPLDVARIDHAIQAAQNAVDRSNAEMLEAQHAASKAAVDGTKSWIR